jgi:hypothetical protein
MRRTRSAWPGSRSSDLLRITPGTGPGYQLTRLRIPDMSTYGVQDIALSDSGAELALALVPTHRQAGGPFGILRIYSVTTGKLLRTWSTNDTNVWGPVITVPGSQSNLMSWAENDRALVLPAMSTVRLLNVTAPGDNLIAGSRLISSANPVTMITEDGKTALSTTVTGTIRRTLRWLAYPLSAPGKTSVRYQVAVTAPKSDGSLAAILWASPSGSTMIVDWAVGPGPTPSGSHFGVVSNGKFTPLRMASASYFPNGWPTMAW